MVQGDAYDPRRVEQTIVQRSGVGPNPLIEGWQSILTGLLDRMQPFLQSARIVTFQRLTPDEKLLFTRINRQVRMPASAMGVYLPPSVRNQLLYTNQGRDVPASEAVPRDDGVLLFTRKASRATIVNALLAHTPYTPAVDVYENGALLAGYVYEDLDACLETLTGVVATHLG